MARKDTNIISLKFVDERDGLGLRGHYLGEGGASAQGGEIELKRIVAHYLAHQVEGARSPVCVTPAPACRT
jgi:hypothetical protein